LSAMDVELGGKRLQLLRELMPNLVCVAVLAATPATDYGFGEIFVKDLHMAATRAGLRLAPVLVEGPSEFAKAFGAMSNAGAQAVIIQGLFDPHRVTLIELATKHRLALMSATRETTAALPVEQPTEFQVVLNMKTAQALGLTASPTLLARCSWLARR